MHKLVKGVTAAAVALGMATSGSAETAPVAQTPQASPTVFYRSVSVDGVSIFYREAGRPDAPTLLLLHGFPSSSRMFEPLLTRLSAHNEIAGSGIVMRLPRPRSLTEYQSVGLSCGE
jgi:hypothetical protein